MKNLLITGNVSSLASHLCQRLSRQYHIVIAARNVPPTAHGKGVELVMLSDGKTLEPVFQTHSFQAVIFLATRGEQESRLSGEADLLSGTLALSKRHDAEKVLYITSGELSRPADALSERGMLMQAMEQLCLSYRKQGMDLAILRIPLVFGAGESDTLIGRMLLSAAGGETAALPFNRDAVLDFISAVEVAQIAYRILGKNGRPEELLLVKGAESLTVRELTALFGLLGASVSQGSEDTGCPPMEGSDLQLSYGLSPSERLSVALDGLYIAAKNAMEKQTVKGGRIRFFLSRHTSLVKGTSIVLGYAAMEALQFFQGQGILPDADLRLLYVALIGAAHGLNAGMFAVVLASFSIARGYGAQGMDLFALLSDWKVWIPFFLLILTGSATGYSRDKGNREARFSKEESLALEKRCAFLQDLYKQSLLSEQPDIQKEEKHENLEKQLAQLRKGQERLEQEWLTLMRREQTRLDRQHDDKISQDGEAIPKKQDDAQADKRQLEKLQAEETERLRNVPVEPARPQMPELENIKDTVTLFQGSHFNHEDSLSAISLPDSLEEDLFEEKESGLDETASGQIVQQQTAHRKGESSLEQDGVLPTGTPFGKLSPSERRRMLEAMQVRYKARQGGKPRRKK